MQFYKFKEQLKDFVVFSMADITMLAPTFRRALLNEWQKKNYIKKIRRGFYMFTDTDINDSSLFLIANKIYQPSYISFEMAFSFYGLIPESVYGITSATTQKTINFKTSFGTFIYHSIKSNLMFGYKLIKYQNQNYKIAEIEKCLLDYFYINPHLKTTDDFKEMRINIDNFKEKVDLKKFKIYLEIFNNKRLESRMNKLIKYIYADA
jgi:predicted transcriptional regulator of viral defense system